MTDKKQCRVCKETDSKLLYKDRTICRKCQSEAVLKNIINKFGNFRNYNLFRNYGIFQEDYDRMYEEQNGLCSICDRERNLIVDHSHKTGKVRALICSGCNTGIGQFEHDLSLFDKAKEYIINHDR